MLFDSHAHLNDLQFDVDRQDVIKRALETYGVQYILNIGYNKETILSSLDLVEKYDFMFSSVGWHPHEASSCKEEDIKWLKTLATHPKVVAWGEVGLDYYRDYSPHLIQRELFKKQIRCAREVGLPLIIHDREAHEDVIQILEEEKAKEIGGVMHCFSGDLKMMEKCIQLNFMIGLGGPVTFKNSKVTKEIAKEVPLDKLLIETDCPYLAPSPFRGKRNETGYIHYIAKTIAEIKGLTLSEIAKITSTNTINLFKLDKLLEKKKY